MSKIILNEVATPTTPSANKGVAYLDSTTGNWTVVKDSGSTVDLETGLGGLFKGPFNRGTSLPSAPTEVRIFILDRQASSEGDIVYLSLEDGQGVWDWTAISHAPDFT